MEFRTVVTLFALYFMVCEVQGTSELTEQCLEAPSTGECRAAIKAWYFDPESCSCKEFVFGGCEGGRNNFRNRERCIRKCQPDTCSLPAETGPCRMMLTSWYYSPDSGTCEQFTYGGCEGNENRFRSARDCLRACRRGKSPRRTVPANDSGCVVPSRSGRRGRENRRQRN